MQQEKLLASLTKNGGIYSENRRDLANQYAKYPNIIVVVHHTKHSNKH